LALGILRRKKAAPGRVWLLLRHHDAQGRGRIPTSEAAHLLTGDSSPLRVCGRRQLANLLATGDGLFWDLAPGRSGEEQIWLRGTARVAAALGVARLGGSPVAVPLSALTGTIGQARAHLYASFHSGRQRAGLLPGRPRPRGPISREALCKLSGATANSQRNYERRARVSRRSAFALGPRLNAADEHDAAWQRGRALFRLRDEEGRYGRPGAVYLAWQLPNEYTGPHAALPRGRQKRLNRALADLFHDGMTGNGEQAASGKWRVASGETAVSGSVISRSVFSKQYPVSSEQCAVVSDQCPVSSSPLSAVGGPSSVVRGPSSVVGGQRSAVGRRLFYASAKAALLSRHAGEKYWRYGEAWLWQPELRVTSDELRVKNGGRMQGSRSAGEQERRPADQAPTINDDLPPATCYLPPTPRCHF
jgi:hypothetical protein